jgi:hypothetical protein
MVRSPVRSLAAVFVAIALLVAIGCVQEEPLEQRVEKYWKARQARDAVTAYRYEHPETRGEEAEYGAKIATGPLAISGVEIAKVEIDGESARVTVRMTYRHALMSRDVKAPIVDVWERHDGRWYHKPPPAEFIAGSGTDDVLRRRTPVAAPPAKP